MVTDEAPSVAGRRRWLSAVLAPGLTFLAVLVLGAARARDRSYWYDEAVTASIVRRSLAGVLEVVTLREAGMGAYFVALRLWSEVFGSDTGLRMFSVVGGALAAALLVSLLQHATSTAVAAVGAVLFVSNDFFLRYLTEARAYSWMMALGVGVCIVVIDLFLVRTQRLAIIAGVVTGLAVATHFAMWFVAGAALLAMWLAFGIDRVMARYVAIAGGLALLIFAPTVPVMIRRRDDQISWIPEPSWSGSKAVLEEWLGGRWWREAVIVGAVLLAIELWRRREWDPIRTAALAVTILTPLLSVTASLVTSFWIGRYLAGAFPLAVATAVLGWHAALQWIVPKRAADLAALGVAGVAAIVFVSSSPFTDDLPLDGWDDAAAFLEAETRPGDAIVLRSFDVAIDHYLGYRPDLEPALVSIPDDGEVYPERLPPEEIDPLLPEDGRVFIVTNDVFAFDPAEFPSLQGRPMELIPFEHALIRAFGVAPAP